MILFPQLSNSTRAFAVNSGFRPAIGGGLAALVGLISALLAKATDLLGSREMPRSANPELVALLDAQAD